MREIATLVPLALACLAFGLYPKPILRTVEKPVAALIAPAQNAVAMRTKRAKQAQQTMIADAVSPRALNHESVTSLGVDPDLASSAARIAAKQGAAR